MMSLAEEREYNIAPKEPMSLQNQTGIDADYISKGFRFKNQLLQSNFEQVTSDIMNRKLGAFLGSMLGDAMGAPFEFLQFGKSSLKENTKFSFPTQQEYEQMFNSNSSILQCAKYTSQHFNLNFGALSGMWTDDSSQMMCLSEVIIRYKKVVGSQLNWAIDDWWNHGFCTPCSKRYEKLVKQLNKGKDHSFGLGQTSLQTIEWFLKQKVARTVEKPCLTQAGHDKTDGNGALMRNAPTFFYKDLEVAMKEAKEQSLTTHKGIDQSVCCMLHTFVGWSYINQKNMDQTGSVDIKLSLPLFQKLQIQLSKAMQSIINCVAPYNWKDEKFNANYNAENSGGYAVDCLALCFHYWYKYKNDALEQLATAGGDADTNAAVLGAMMGAKLGLKHFGQLLKGVLEFDEYGYCCARALAMCDIE